MIQAHVFKASQVTNTDRMKTIDQFSQHTSLTPSDIGAIAVNEEKEGGLIDQYKIGHITTEEFREGINDLILEEGGITLSDEIFDNCWNAMCIVKPEKVSKLHDLQQKHNFHVHIISGTNPLQHDFIQKEMNKAAKKPEISYTLSHELRTLDKNLLKQNAERILKAQGYEPIWHMEEQHNHETNALEILGNHYDESSV